MKHPLTTFSFAMLGFYALLWGAQMLFPGNAASTVVVVLVTIAGIVIIRPGWNIRPGRPVGYWAVLFSLLLGSAVIAAYFLRLIKIPLPYDTAALNTLTVLPGVAAVTFIEELLFRQVMFRWLEKHLISGRAAVLATAAAFGCAHLGPVLTQISGDVRFYLLQSLYMLWVGALLGEIRRATNSWVMSWIGHSAYNLAVLFLL